MAGDLGNNELQAVVERPLAVEWSVDALADLGRFAAFLQAAAPNLASSVAGEIVAKTRIIAERPSIGRPIEGAGRRQLVLRVLKAPYVLQYRVDGPRVVILHVFHSRENWK